MDFKAKIFGLKNEKNIKQEDWKNEQFTKSKNRNRCSKP